MSAFKPAFLFPETAADGLSARRSRLFAALYHAKIQRILGSKDHAGDHNETGYDTHS